MGDAACIGKPPHWFFPDDNGEANRSRDGYLYALAVCRHCPVREACLDYAMAAERDARWRFGVFGGMTPHERWIHDPRWRDSNP